MNILQHLLGIDPKNAISDTIWDTTETLVHRATLLETIEDSSKLLRAPSVQKFSCPHCRADVTSPNRKSSLPHHNFTAVNLTTQQNQTGAVQVPPLPPPLPPPQISAPIPPPPPMSNNNSNHFSNIPKPPMCPSPSKLIQSSNDTNRSKTPDISAESFKPLPQQEIPTPRAKMKTINWNKIPPNKVVGKSNIWTIVADSHQNSPMAEMNWDEMEGLFCQQVTQGSPKLGRESSNTDTIERRSRKENEVL